jgi:hypothetical protein
MRHDVRLRVDSRFEVVKLSTALRCSLNLFSLTEILDHEDEIIVYLRNIGKCSPNDTASHPGRRHLSETLNIVQLSLTSFVLMRCGVWIQTVNWMQTASRMRVMKPTWCTIYLQFIRTATCSGLLVAHDQEVAMHIRVCDSRCVFYVRISRLRRTTHTNCPIFIATSW